MELMIKNRLIPAPSAGRITGGAVTVLDGSAVDVILNPRERNYSGWTDMGVGDPSPPIRTSIIKPCVQGCQKGNRLIGSIGSIV